MIISQYICWPVRTTWTHRAIEKISDRPISDHRKKGSKL
jgi:hypothetical protein